MNIDAGDIAGLAAGLASGVITERMIERQLGSGVLSQVVAYGSGAVVTGLVADVVSGFFSGDGNSSLLDDIFG